MTTPPNPDSKCSKINNNIHHSKEEIQTSTEVLDQNTAIMAAVEATTKALETATISKTKELKGASTPPFAPQSTN
jgi:hypothetical protein